MTDLPHFALPFRFVGGAAAVLEQDTADEILACVEAVIRCPLGYRDELPEFGVRDMTFEQGGPDMLAIEAALSDWEPRAQVALAERRDRYDELVSTVTVRVSAPTDD